MVAGRPVLAWRSSTRRSANTLNPPYVVAGSSRWTKSSVHGNSPDWA